MVPSDRFCISESGLHERQQVRDLMDRVHGFLIGSALMRAPNLERAVRDMIYGPVKVCGLTQPEHAEAAWRHGATWGGLVFVADSPRAVDKKQATRVSADVPLQWVGVFVNAPVDTVVELAADVRLTAVQLHGEESDDYVRQLRRALRPECQIWKAYRIQDSLPQHTLPETEKLVFDTFAGAARGGTGVRWNWNLLEDYPAKHRVLLSGGLSPSSAWVASRSGAWGLDVNSGVETQPGSKDPELIRAFFEQIRQRR
jgi:indole-3-glycerol phosphate synthase/phosphoribosylanthranilate isomerase